MKPRVCILRTDGTNCDEETFYAFNKSGGESELVHVNMLRSGEKRLLDYHILALPGGFSYGDDVHSGKILAVELTSFLKEELQEFVAAGKPVLGICNGFQALVRTGLLPDGQVSGEIKAALIHNDSGRFECRWIKLLIEKTNCIFVMNNEGEQISLQVAHGEGKFYTDPATLNEIESAGRVVFRYSGEGALPTDEYPANPNGSLNAIAGICDSTGLILGMMPHPERFVDQIHYPNWRRGNQLKPQGEAVFQNAVNYAREM
jgi:phosphoribosylformylglycinamidine synthase